MKKLFVLLLVLMLIFSLCACNRTQSANDRQQEQGERLLPDGTVTNVAVSSLPEGHDYAFSGDDAKAIVDYLSKLHLKSKFEENPDEYNGMTWVIALEYESGETVKVYHFGNMFIRSEKGSWYRMTYEEASRFAALLHELDG